MVCPRCNAATLVELDRAGISIDRCTRCRGIWLDRGELDKLIAAEREVADDADDADGIDDASDTRRRRDVDRRRDEDDAPEGSRRSAWWSLFD